MNTTPVPALGAPFLAACALLGTAGVAKAIRPQFTARALQVAGLPAGRVKVRVGAVLEVAVAVAALALPGRLTGSLVAAVYLGFAGFIAVAVLRRWPLSTCGCFARPDSKPRWTHVMLNLAAATSAAAWASDPPSTLIDAMREQPWEGWPLLLVSAVISVLAYVVWTIPEGVAGGLWHRRPAAP